MGFSLLGDVLTHWQQYEGDDSIYVEEGAVLSPESPVSVVPFDPSIKKRVLPGQRYLLSFEQVEEVITGLEAQLGRKTSVGEKLQAVLHYAVHDAFLDPAKLRS
jgi:hypothetical protein